MNGRWICPKCGYESYTADRFDGADDLFDVKINRLTVISCNRCRYTELYREDTDDPNQFPGFFIGG